MRPILPGEDAPHPNAGSRGLASEPQHTVIPLAEIAITLLRLGATSFGGPAIVTQLRRRVVEEKTWLSDNEFEESLAFIQMLPGAIAVQTAAHVAWRVRGWSGALVAFTCYLFPSFALMLLLSAAYFRYSAMPPVPAIFASLSAVIVAILIDAILGLVKPAVRDVKGLAICAIATIAFFAGASNLVVLGTTALLGILLRLAPTGPASLQPSPSTLGRRRRSLAIAGVVAFIVASSLFLTSIAIPGMGRLAAKMAKINLLAFGGGYTAIALMHDDLVGNPPRGWLSSTQFVDGLALGQITPGPVLITATFVGFRVGGVAGAVVATIAGFLPSCLLLLGFAPFLDRIGRNRIAQSALRGLLAGFVGMLLFVLGQVAGSAYNSLWSPLLTIAAVIALRFRVPVIAVILPAALLSLLLFR